MHPAVPGLAETPYELSFRMRGLTKLRLVIDDNSASLRTSIRVRTAEGDSMSVRAETCPLAAVAGLHDVTLLGAERIEYPIRLDMAPVSSPGHALILRVAGTDWVLPHDEAPVNAQILNRRIAAAIKA